MSLGKESDGKPINKNMHVIIRLPWNRPGTAQGISIAPVTQLKPCNLPEEPPVVHDMAEYNGPLELETQPLSPIRNQINSSKGDIVKPDFLPVNVAQIDNKSSIDYNSLSNRPTSPPINIEDYSDIRDP
eukprot:Ihof_evm8s134 gene=Ihof_evmTU8s134